MPDITALVSVGRHPVSGRPRRAPLDARAVELGLALAGPALRMVHAGDPGVPALRDYLGMGLAQIDVLKLPGEADPLPALVEYLTQQKPDIVLAGLAAEGGEDSGLLPYLLAEALGCPVVGDVVDISLAGDRARILQSLPRGHRRALDVTPPLVAAIGPAAAAPRQSAFGPARRGRIEVLEAAVVLDEARQSWDWQAAKLRPKRLKAAAGKTAAERLAAMTSVASSGKVLAGLTPEQAAEQIYVFLVEEGLASRDEPQSP